MTLGSHQQSVGKSQVHITPKWIIDRLGPFDLDPAAGRPWACAVSNWSTHGLERDWFGLVYLNPPFDRYEVGDWIAKLAAHGNGITLLHARTEAGWFEPIWHRAAAILFMADRIKFCRTDGTEQPANSGAPPILAAFGDEAVLRLHRSALVTRWHNQAAASVRPHLSVVGGTRAKSQADICSQCGQPIPPTGLRLPPIKQRIFEAVQRHPGISAEELRRLVWAHDPNGGPDNFKCLHVHVNQLNALLAAHGIVVRSQGGGYQIRSA